METNNTPVTVCSCIALLSFSLLCADGVWSLRSVDSVVSALPKQVDARVESIQRDVNRQLFLAITDANNRINGALTVVDQRTGQALKIVDNRSAALVDIGGGGIAIVAKVADHAENDINARLEDTNKILADTTKPVTEAAQQINAALPDFLDCQLTDDGVGNKGCLYARYNDLSSSLDRTLSSVAKAAPIMTADAEKMADASVVTSESVAATSVEVTKAATNFNKPQTKMQAFRSWLLTLARVYGAL